MSEKEIVTLMRTVRSNFPDKFHETIGYMKGINDSKNMLERNNVEHGTRQNSSEKQ